MASIISVAGHHWCPWSQRRESIQEAVDEILFPEI
jgi:hypothetical protein